MTNHITLLLRGIVAMALCACHRSAPMSGIATDSVCVPARVPRSEGHIQIDGPGSFGPQPGDSLVIVINGREQWRGTLAACAPELASPGIDAARWVPPTDTVSSASIGRSEGGGRSKTFVLTLRTRPK